MHNYFTHQNLDVLSLQALLGLTIKITHEVAEHFTQLPVGMYSLYDL